MRQALGETIAALMPEHPGARHPDAAAAATASGRSSERVYRAVLDAVRAAPADLLRADRDHGADAALADLPSVVLPLAVPDLPVILWCRSAAPARHGRSSARSRRWPRKVVMDSCDHADAAGRAAAHGGCDPPRRHASAIWPGRG